LCHLGQIGQGAIRAEEQVAQRLGTVREVVARALRSLRSCGVIHPGYTDTAMVRAMGEELIAKHVLPYTQLGRLIRPQEIADAICFMISNSAVSGQLWADAGYHPSA